MNDVTQHSNSDNVMPYLPKPWWPVFRLRKEANTLSMKVLFPLLAALKRSVSLPILQGDHTARLETIFTQQQLESCVYCVCVCVCVLSGGERNRIGVIRASVWVASFPVSTTSFFACCRSFFSSKPKKKKLAAEAGNEASAWLRGMQT